MMALSSFSKFIGPRKRADDTLWSGRFVTCIPLRSLGTHVTYQSEVGLWCPSAFDVPLLLLFSGTSQSCPLLTWWFASAEFAVENGLSYSGVVHTWDVTRPSKLSEHQHGFNACCVCSLQDVLVGDIVMPLDAQNGSQASLVE